jgi:uncharacterized protein with GYD domain
MRLRRLELSAYRCFPGRVEIDSLGDGLTIIVGDNEEGKSTLLAGLQSVLFDRHNLTGEAADAMLPYGSAVRPEITLDFDFDGARYRLRKAFCQRPEADLTVISGDGPRWTGAAAEDRLREMLAFTPPGRGGARSENRGLQALFWVEQGSAHLAPSLNDTARGTLAGALEREVGTVVGGERGRFLLNRIKARLDRFFTATGRPRTGGPLAVAQTAVDEASARRDGLRSRLEEFETKTSELARARQRLADLEHDDPLNAAEARIEAAAAEVRIVENLESDLKTAVAQCKAAQAQEELAQGLVAERLRIRSEMEKARQESAMAADDEARKREELVTADASFEQAKRAHADAKRDADAAAVEEAKAQLLAGLLEAHARLVEANQRLEKAERTAAALRELHAQIEANPIDPKALRSLQKLATAAREAELSLQGSATLVEFQPEFGRHVAIEGAAVEADRLTVAEPTRISLEGFGAIRVVPGGEELVSIRARAERARDALARAFAEHGLATLQEAERRVDDRERQAVEAKTHETILAIHAPEGLETLRSSVEVLRAQVHEAEQAAGDARTEGVEIPIHVARERATSAAKGLTKCREAERKAFEAVLAEEGQRKVAAAALAVASARRSEASAKAASLAAEVERAEAERGDDVLAQRHETAAAALAEAVAAKERAERALRDSDPEGARTELKQATDARNAVAKQLEQARQRVNDFIIELRTLGQQDLAAQLETAEGDAARAEAALARATHEAEALQLLHKTLFEAEREAQETFMAPITRRVAPYLRRLFPDSEIVLDDTTLQVTHLRRRGHDEPFERLSIGTREQLAVLTRIAFADLLREHARDSPIVLDDALVYSDDGRFSEIQRILVRASASTQIVVLTCHERAYFSLGAPIIRLAECGT